MRADILYDTLFDAGFQPELVEEDTEIALCCPFCQDDRPRLYISIDHGGWICFHCNEEGNVHKLLMEALDLSGHEAFKIENKLFPISDTPFDDDGIPVSRAASFKQAPAENKTLHLPRQTEAFAEFVDDKQKPFEYYLLGRGVSLSLATRYGIGYARSGRFANRVIIPVYNGSTLCTFIARTILKECPNCERPLNDCTCRPYKFPKVLTPTNSEGAQARGTLFNFDKVRGGTGPIVVVEGVFDALREPGNAVALLGAGFSRAQLEQLLTLAREGREIILMLDPDTAGFKGMYKLATALASEMVPVRVAILPGKDPGDCTQAEWDAAVLCARRFEL